MRCGQRFFDFNSHLSVRLLSFVSLSSPSFVSSSTNENTSSKFASVAVENLLPNMYSFPQIIQITTHKYSFIHSIPPGQSSGRAGIQSLKIAAQTNNIRKNPHRRHLSSGTRAFYYQRVVFISFCRERHNVFRTRQVIKRM